MSLCVSPVSSLMSRHCSVGTGAGSPSLEAEQRGPEDRAAKSSKQTQLPGMATVGMGPAQGPAQGTHWEHWEPAAGGFGMASVPHLREANVAIALFSWSGSSVSPPGSGWL